MLLRWKLINNLKKSQTVPSCLRFFNFTALTFSTTHNLTSICFEIPVAIKTATPIGNNAEKSK